ncbi:MAG: class I SAM-dependent methyltransferase [Saprospiraceae bacterium]|nr:class I SAM-dependent methyltransferase [Saprospiraceae bacterium]
MTKADKARLRGDLFRHLDGIVTAPTALALHKRGVLDFLLKEKNASLSEIREAMGANEGYLNVGLHILASQGWLDYEIINDKDIQISINEKSSEAFQLIPLYEDVVELMRMSEKYHPRKFDVAPFQFLERIFEKFKNNYGLEITEEPDNLARQILKHIEGMIVGPTIVALGMSGMFHKYFMEASFKPGEFHTDGQSFGRLLDMLVFLGWFDKKNETYRFTDKGMFFARRASAYGVTVSYIPMFRKVEELIFGEPGILWNLPKGAKEIHVDREMNVWGSGGAHSAYFKVIDNIIIDLFNQPLEMQPKGVLDMGCGNGAFLIHLYEVIEQKTLRGKHLEDHPLFLIGADYNQAALDVTRKNIVQAGIWAKLIWGDIGRPDLLAEDLNENYGIGLGDLLNVRTFLDHNRIWSDPKVRTEKEKGDSNGAYAFRGRRITNTEVEDNLREHLQNWAPYFSKYGLRTIELHTIAPTLIASNLGRTAATAYNATHGFSDQYIVEIEVFLKVAKEAGLNPDERFFRRFPNSDLGTVSVNLFKRD